MATKRKRAPTKDSGDILEFVTTQSFTVGTCNRIRSLIASICSDLIPSVDGLVANREDRSRDLIRIWTTDRAWPVDTNWTDESCAIFPITRKRTGVPTIVKPLIISMELSKRSATGEVSNWEASRVVAFVQYLFTTGLLLRKWPVRLLPKDERKSSAAPKPGVKRKTFVDGRVRHCLAPVIDAPPTAISQNTIVRYIHSHPDEYRECLILTQTESITRALLAHRYKRLSLFVHPDKQQNADFSRVEMAKAAFDIMTHARNRLLERLS